MRADIHHGPEHKLHKEAGYISARPNLVISESLLRCTAGPYIWVSSGHVGGSARLIQAAAFLDSIVAYWTHAADFCNTIPLRADILRTAKIVRYVPISDETTRPTHRR
jgi:hypothetical protein